MIPRSSGFLHIAPHRIAPHLITMSRIIVKCIPKHATELRLRDFFGQHGAVTDVKLMKKRNGESRGFAFIGYKSDADAENAVHYFNRTFLDTLRLDVQLAMTFSDPDVPLSVREKKRQTLQRLREQEDRLTAQQEREQQKKRQKTEKTSKLDAEIAADPKLREFIDTFKPAAQVQSWSNGPAPAPDAPGAKELEEALKVVDGEENVPEPGSDAEYEDFGARNADEDEDMKDGETEGFVRLESTVNTRKAEISTEASVSALDQPADSLAQDSAVSDLDWLKQRRVRIRENEDGPADAATATTGESEIAATSTTKLAQLSKTQNHEASRTAPANVAPDPAAQIALTGRLFIRNILYSASEDDFRSLFSEYGTLTEVHMAVDTRTGKPKGFVYVQFATPSDAVAAYEALDKQIFQGRLLHILPGEPKKDHRMDEFALKNLPLKKQRELQKKSQAALAKFNWNSLYMNSDAVLDSVAAKLGMSKSQLVDPASSGSAVKQALAEAHVIGDVRLFFEKHGVDLLAFDKKARDDRVILVKNFPFGTTPAEITDLFVTYGPLRRVLMPPAGTIAIVEFRDAPAARAAFTKLAYRMFKKLILYLEKGPEDLFMPGLEPVAIEQPVAENAASDQAVEAVSAADVMDADVDSEVSGPTVSVFVKNLSFTTSATTLADTFRSAPGYVVAVIKTKRDPKTAGATLSMGYGFVEFRSRADADAAISAFDGHVLDGHRIQMKISHRAGTSNNTSNATPKSARSAKIIIKNLPFEASRKDVFELFGAYGQLKSVRVPRKFDKSARGFAFVEFSLAKEAENAMDQLTGVHLLGRRLVMQYAEKDAESAEEEIAKMTRKALKQAASREMAALRMTGEKFLMGDEENIEE